ncbi:penicillin-binding protein 1A [Limimonas halophila]|uniref:Penicillin-binding protein 1A n=1 Tax=Limimonas halophila TaxID=1082479 RepID=A0A1G7T550_9PROT|nr:PBP1A family penicillin-binding protein [Limimonas halophila]SDG30212.1 penicillin-binding protein 1A [Limimonas halophila]
MARRRRKQEDRATTGSGPHKRRPLLRLAKWAFVLGVWGLVALAALVAYYAHDLPDVERAMAETREPTVTFRARDGSVLATYGNAYGGRVELDALPPSLPRAVMAVEDRRFYDHHGVDPLGLLRASWVNLRAWDVVQGGSTITQQLAKNLFLSPAQTLKRKVQELILAVWLERTFSKDEILELYLNRVYLGAGVYGVDAAAQRYFGKSARELTLYESAMLAGMLKAPSDLNPRHHPDAAHARTETVLNDMVAAGFISDARAERAARERRRGHAAVSTSGRYFTDWAMKRVRGRIGTPRRDITVHTTLDPDLQRVTQRTLSDTLAEEGRAADAGQGAVVSMTPDGAVRALVGGSGYAETPYNRATQARRQPASTFKPFVYLAAVEDGMTPDTRMVDEPVTVNGWSPENYDDTYRGEVTLREAFARSINSVAAKLIARVGAETVVRAAHRLGITSELQPHPSLALGTSEVSLLHLTGAYAVFANRGRDAQPYGVQRITADDGEVLYEHPDRPGSRLVAEPHVRRMTDLLRADIVWGTGTGADPGRPAGGKTGTSQNARDAWFVGFTAELVTGVWLGNDDGRPMDGVTGSGLPAAIWRQVTRQALRGVPEKPLPGRTPRVADKPEGESTRAETGSGGDGVISRIIDSLDGGSSRARTPQEGPESHELNRGR